MSGSWIYSAPTQETIRITCAGKVDRLVDINGIGVLKIAPGCKGQSRQGSIMAESTRTSLEQYVYKPYTPDLQLNITKLFPSLSDLSTTQMTIDSWTPQAGFWLKKEKGLNDIIEKFERIGEHRRSERYHSSLFYGGLSMNVIVILVIIGVIHKFCKSKQKSHKETIIVGAPHHSAPSTPRRSIRKRKSINNTHTEHLSKSEKEKPQESKDITNSDTHRQSALTDS